MLWSAWVITEINFSFFLGSHCAAHSRFYCLNAYETTISLEEQQFGYGYGYQHVQGDVPGNYIELQVELKKIWFNPERVAQ